MDRPNLTGAVAPAAVHAPGRAPPVLTRYSHRAVTIVDAERLGGTR